MGGVVTMLRALLTIFGGTILGAVSRGGRVNTQSNRAEVEQKQCDRIRLERDLRDAIRDNELNLVYQPIVDPTGETMLGVEALCRWRHPSLGDISPVTFIAIAEDAGLIDLLGEWVLRRASREALDWPGLRVAVNVSSLQFCKPDFVALVQNVLSETGLSPTRLELELTESLFVQDINGALGKMRNLKALGIRLALDDFGTGYSSLSYLLSLPFDKLKIDRSFILKLETGASGAAIVHSIVSLGRALGMHVTAEGVETGEQHQFLRIAGVHSFQGYLFSRPVEAREITRRLAAQAEMQRATLDALTARKA
jgi:EAL domain-containing protein (putative c-di-GMP-specific phosphodiesterase class I)